MIVSKPAIIAHSGQIFFNFLAMACYASVAAFQAKWHVGPCTCSNHFIRAVSTDRPMCSWSLRIRNLRFNRRDPPISIHAPRSRCLRTLRQVRPTRTDTQGGPRELHPHGNRSDLLSANRVSAALFNLRTWCTGANRSNTALYRPSQYGLSRGVKTPQRIPVRKSKAMTSRTACQGGVILRKLHPSSSGLPSVRNFLLYCLSMHTLLISSL